MNAEDIDLHLRKAIRASEDVLPIKTYIFDKMMGKSEVMLNVFKNVLKIAKSNANVMIFGESGTGKELLARSIHLRSARNLKAFIPVDCVALPENLLESELFGHEKGSFTGAISTRRGLFEYAHRGTLFLDEISELAPNLQAKLLRMLQEREFRRIGGQQLIRVDLRIISTTNRDPAQAIRDNHFREDLFYRLNVVPMELPPLRERREDIPLLIEYYLQYFGKGSKGQKQVDSEVMEILYHYSWPGNIRELRNLVECVVTLTDEKQVITRNDLPKLFLPNGLTEHDLTNCPYKDAKEKFLAGFNRKYFLKLLEETGRNVSKTAGKAQVSRRTVYRMIDDYDL